MASDLTTANFIYKRKYADRLADVAMRAHPLFARIAKPGGFTGEDFSYPVRYANPQAVSGIFANAQTQSQAVAGAGSSGVKFRMLRRPKHGVVLMDGEAIAACGDDGAFVELVTLEMDGALEEMGDAYGFELYRNGTGVRGRRLSITGNVVTLETPDDARNFKVKMTIVASPNADGSVPQLGSCKITAVDEDAGTITVDNPANITGFANNMYLLRQGDQGTALEGLALLTPLTAPVFGSDSFRGVDRGQDVKRLAGSRLTTAEASGNTIEENAGRVAIKIGQGGDDKNKELNLNPVRFWEVVRRVGAKTEFRSSDVAPKLYFESFTIATPAGSMTCYSDPDCPLSELRITRADGHALKTLKTIPHVNRDDGNAFLRASNSDGLEARFRGFGNYMQTNPRGFGVAPIA